MSPKQRAAEAALQFVHSDMIVGIGTGSTADFFILALGAALKDGRLKKIRGVPTSIQSEHRAAQLGIPVFSLASLPHPDIVIDGADEVDPQLDLIKGLGGALLREKMVAQSAGRMIVIADSSKTVTTLGEKSALPVEVVPFAHEIHREYLQSLGCTPTLRKLPTGAAYVTDNGNYIYDCRFKAIDDARALEQSIKRQAGIVEVGLFIGIAETVVIADDSTVEIRHRQGN